VGCASEECHAAGFMARKRQQAAAVQGGQSQKGEVVQSTLECGSLLPLSFA